MIQIINRDIDRICTDFLHKVQAKNYKSENLYFQYYKQNLERIITCPAEKLPHLITEFDREFPIHDSEWELFCQYMKGQYESFIQKNGIWLAQSLNVLVCPYCNRQYTFTVDGAHKIRPQFDHFYPKSLYPYLALSFYNLIPCCPVCNHTKGEKLIGQNPYISGFDDDCYFTIDRIDRCIMQNEDWNILFSGNELWRTNIEAFSLIELYNQHKDYAREIAFRAVVYETSYIDDLKNEFTASGLSGPEIERIVWGNYIQPDEFGKRPLAHLSYDIINLIQGRKIV